MKYNKYVCLPCGYIYDEEKGLPEEDISPFTKWENISSDWLCPECGATKDQFEILTNEQEIIY